MYTHAGEHVVRCVACRIRWAVLADTFLQVDALVFDRLDARLVHVGRKGLVIVDICPRDVDVQVGDRVDADLVGRLGADLLGGFGTFNVHVDLRLCGDLVRQDLVKVCRQGWHDGCGRGRGKGGSSRQGREESHDRGWLGVGPVVGRVPAHVSVAELQVQSCSHLDIGLGVERGVGGHFNRHFKVDQERDWAHLKVDQVGVRDEVDGLVDASVPVGLCDGAEDERAVGVHVSEPG